jgi:hypothetical protein
MFQLCLNSFLIYFPGTIVLLHAKFSCMVLPRPIKKLMFYYPLRWMEKQKQKFELPFHWWNFPIFFQKKKCLSLNIRGYLFKLEVMYYNVSIFEIYFVPFRKLLCDLFDVDGFVWNSLPNFKSSFSLVVPPERPFTQSPGVMSERGHMAFHHSDIQGIESSFGDTTSKLWSFKLLPSFL